MNIAEGEWTYQNAILIVFTCLFIVGMCASIWIGHTSSVAAKLEQQLRYPYHGIINDSLWDSCAIPSTTENGIGLHEFDTHNQTCRGVYYRVVDWDNNHVYEFDSDGIYCFKRNDYDKRCITL